MIEFFKNFKLNFPLLFMQLYAQSFRARGELSTTVMHKKHSLAKLKFHISTRRTVKFYIFTKVIVVVL